MDILAAASWRSAGVFQGSYLRDISSIADGMATLGPIVAAQHVDCGGRNAPTSVSCTVRLLLSGVQYWTRINSP